MGQVNPGLEPTANHERAERLARQTWLIGQKTEELATLIAKPHLTADHFPPGFTERVKIVVKNVIRSGHGDEELNFWLRMVAVGREKPDRRLFAELELQQPEMLRQLRALEDTYDQYHKRRGSEPQVKELDLGR